MYPSWTKSTSGEDIQEIAKGNDPALCHEVARTKNLPIPIYQVENAAKGETHGTYSVVFII
jgi:hypothetical protein